MLAFIFLYAFKYINGILLLRSISVTIFPSCTTKHIFRTRLFPLFTTNRTCPIVTLQKGKHVASTRSDAKQPLKKFIELEIGGLTNAFVLISANGNVSQIIRCDWEFSFKRIRTDIFMRFLFIIKSHYCQQWVHRIRYFRDCKTQGPIKGRLRIPLI